MVLVCVWCGLWEGGGNEVCVHGVKKPRMWVWDVDMWWWWGGEGAGDKVFVHVSV